MDRKVAVPLMSFMEHPSIIGGIQHSKQVLTLQLRFPVILCLFHLQFYLRSRRVDSIPALHASALQQCTRV